MTVYLEDPQTGDRSEETVTDLSGRFTLYPPGSSTYQLCWSSEVYGDGCTPANLAAGGTPQFLSTVYVELSRKEGFVAMIGEVTTAVGDSARMFDPLLNINAFATVALLQAGRLHLPRTSEADVLTEELLNYEIRVDENANDRYGAFRVGTHDDLVTALGLAVQVEYAVKTVSLVWGRRSRR